MKKLLFLLFILVSVFSQAQNDNPYADKSNPYSKLIDNLNGISLKCGLIDFTTFRGLDINFSQIRFSSYLQDQLGLAYKGSTDQKTVRILKFVPKVSSRNEFITTKYIVHNRKDILGYYQTEDGTYDIIDRVEISGSKNIIIDIFLKFWCPLKTTIGGYKIGEVAFKEFYSDKITLIGVSPSTAKIVIDKGTMTMDYYTTFGIGAKKNDSITAKSE